MENKWIILHNCPGPEPAWWGEDEKPVLFDTEREAQLKMMEDFHDLVGDHIQQFKDGDRDFDEIDKECDEWVEPCTLHEDGCITLETDDNFYDPKTWVR